MNENSIIILKELAKHKFLTRSLFALTGLTISRNHFSSLMKKLSNDL